jgi:hypothetical protein
MIFRPTCTVESSIEDMPRDIGTKEWRTGWNNDAASDKRYWPAEANASGLLRAQTNTKALPNRSKLLSDMNHKRQIYYPSYNLIIYL